VIPDSFIQELLARIDIVTVVERHVTLRKTGANFSACCPFHAEKTPSFTVSPTKQFYHCFGCGAHGSAISFVMQYSGLGFIEAVEDLASSVGLSVPHEERNPAEPNPPEHAKKAP
jgi:DNA primase